MRALLAPLAVLALIGAGCTSSRTPEPLRAGDLGRRLPAAATELGQSSLLSACAGYAGLSNASAAAQDVVSSWFEVVSHIDRCEIGAARYYSGLETEENIAARLAAVATGGPPACGAQARGIVARVQAANRRVRDWLPRGVDLCSQRELSQDAYAFAEQVTRSTAAIRCQIDRDFPELATGGCR